MNELATPSSLSYSFECLPDPHTDSAQIHRPCLPLPSLPTLPCPVETLQPGPWLARPLVLKAGRGQGKEQGKWLGVQETPTVSPPGASCGEGSSQPGVLNRLWSPWEPKGRGARAGGGETAQAC